ncbi:hypothetical protein Pve01_10590 [Planomonospora venezuelensis]|nr:hypothetical protein Pve01_10590 [Planomonospora venezuelensis]
MGTVWRAHDRSLGRDVAIKEIRQEPGLSEAQRSELRERMIREGRTAARISHPSVATIHDAIIEDGSPWIIMELVQARSLEQVIEEEGPLPPRLVAEIGVDLLGALRAAHAQGILHRDVKPGNVLITESGRVVLTDFGIAKAAGDTSLTQTGMVIGSPGYTAPERARGEHTGPESDLWSLGATLYFAVEGRPAYERSSVAETLAALMTESADPPVQAGPLRPVLEHLLEKDYTARLTASQAAAMLRAVADTPSAGAVPPEVPAEPPAAASGDGGPTAPAGSPDGPGAAAGAAPGTGNGTGSGPEDGAAQDEEFDADRTMLVIRPKTGLRLPGTEETPVAAAPLAASPPAVPDTAPPVAPPAASPATPPPARPRPPVTSSELGVHVAGRPRTPVPPGDRDGGTPGAPPVEDSSATPPHGFPVVSRTGGPGAPMTPPPVNPAGPSPDDESTAVGMLPGHGGPGGFGGPGGPLPGGIPQQPLPPPGYGPGPGNGALPPTRGLGTDLFSIAQAQGAESARPRGNRNGTLVLIGVAAVSLVIIMILVVAAFADSRESSTAAAGVATAPTAGPDAAAGAASSGLRSHKDPGGFTISVPDPLKGGTDGDDVVFRSSDDPRYLRVNTAPHVSDDVRKTVTAIQNAAAEAGSYPGYRLVGVTEADPEPYAGADTADWEFTYLAGGKTVHVLARFVSLPGKDDYVIYWAVPAASWEEQAGVRDEVLTSFRPKQGADGS